MRSQSYSLADETLPPIDDDVPSRRNSITSQTSQGSRRSIQVEEARKDSKSASQTGSREGSRPASQSVSREGSRPASGNARVSRVSVPEQAAARISEVVRPSPAGPTAELVQKLDQIGMFPEKHASLMDALDRTRVRHSDISPQDFGEKSGFSKRFCLGGSHFSKCLGRKGFGEEFEFLDFAWGELTVDETMSS